MAFARPVRAVARARSPTAPCGRGRGGRRLLRPVPAGGFPRPACRLDLDRHRLRPRGKAPEPADHRPFAPGLVVEGDARQAAGETLVVARPVELAVEPRGADLEDVAAAAVVREVEERRGLLRHQLTVAQGDPAGGGGGHGGGLGSRLRPVEDQAQDVALDLDVVELHPGRAGDRLELGPEPGVDLPLPGWRRGDGRQLAAIRPVGSRGSVGRFARLSRVAWRSVIRPLIEGCWTLVALAHKWHYDSSTVRAGRGASSRPEGAAKR